MIMGTEIPALITILMAIERIVAVKRPTWFHKYWNQSLKWKLLFAVVLIEFGSIGCAAVSAYNDYTESADQHCAIITSTAIWYSTSHYTFVVLAYVISFASLLFIYVTHRKQHKVNQLQLSYITSYISHIQQTMAEEKRHPKLMLYLVVTGLSIVLFSLPSLVMIGSAWKLFVTTDIVIGLTYSATGFSSIVNTIIFFIFQEDFRQRLKHVISRIRAGKWTASVHDDGSDMRRLNVAASTIGGGMTMIDKTAEAAECNAGDDCHVKYNDCDSDTSIRIDYVFVHVNVKLTYMTTVSNRS